MTTDPSPDPVIRTFTVPESADRQRIDLFLSHCCDGYSRTQVRLAVHEGAAEVDGRIIRPSYKVRTGQAIRFRLPPPPSDDTVAENIPLHVLYEDDAFVVLNKPSGMVVHPSRGHWSGTLTAALAYRFRQLSDVGGPTRPGIVHRLDRDTSGVIVVAKTNATHLHLSEQFAARTVQKEYFAFVLGHVDRDRDHIDASIGLHPYQRDKQAIRSDHPSVRPAQTFYETVFRGGRISGMRLSPRTGRTHQLRVHMTHIGHPILCDRLYGGHREMTRDEIRGIRGSDAVAGESNPKLIQRQALHARSLTLAHPQTGWRMSFRADWPDDLRAVARAVDYELPES